MRRLTDRDKAIWAEFTAHDQRVKPTVTSLREKGWAIDPEDVRRVVAKVKRLTSSVF